MNEVLSTVDELDSQLAEAVKRAATRAEHVRLSQIQATAQRLRLSLGIVLPPTDLQESA